MDEKVYYPNDPEEKDPVIVKLKKLMEGLPNGGWPDIFYLKDKPVAITVEGETHWLYDLDYIMEEVTSMIDEIRKARGLE